MEAITSQTTAFGIGDGGGVSIEQNTTISINGTTVFQSNLEYGCGDAIYAVNDSTVYLRENTKLINNSAHSDGDGIFGRR